MDHVLNRLESGLWPASVIGVVASSRIDIPLHGSTTSEAADRGQGLTGDRGLGPSQEAIAHS
jgi:hypothetical protein